MHLSMIVFGITTCAITTAQMVPMLPLDEWTYEHGIQVNFCTPKTTFFFRPHSSNPKTKVWVLVRWHWYSETIVKTRIWSTKLIPHVYWCRQWSFDSVSRLTDGPLSILAPSVSRRVNNVRHEFNIYRRTDNLSFDEKLEWHVVPANNCCFSLKIFVLGKVRLTVDRRLYLLL